MITFGDYIQPKSVDEAYESLISKKSARLIGGGCFLRMGNRRIGLAIDLSQAGLDYIKDAGEEIEIGAMTSLRSFETSELLKEHFGYMIGDSVKHIIGVQLRNIATIGATVYSKYGFSDPITALLALDADICLYQGGRMALGDFLKEVGHRRDVLEKIIIKKSNKRGSFQTLRNSQVDYAILSVAVVDDEKGIRISIGARPGRAALAIKAMEYINSKGLCEEIASKAGEIAAEELHYGSNNRGSGAYRKELSKILVKRALLEVSK
ncbi:FAD-binding protein [Tissierella creatinini]|nr:FAD-binding protein [Tissierella creatinini]TJX65582.1 FAD-binding protein [Soehngenia saccharolytica]